MKPKKIWVVKPVVYLLILSNLIMSVLPVFYNKTLFFVTLPIGVTVSLFCIIKINTLTKYINSMVFSLQTQFDVSQHQGLHNFPISIIVVSEKSEIIWHNDKFSKNVLSNEYLLGEQFNIITNLPLIDFIDGKSQLIEYNQKYYKVYGFSSVDNNKTLYTLYFIEITKLKKLEIEYSLSRPVVISLVIDNYQELMQNLKESEKSILSGEIDKVLEELIGTTTGFLNRLDRDRFIAVIEKRNLETLIENKFDILNKARKIDINNGVPVTLSIGIGTGGKTFLENKEFANKSLDMALGRGGDQVAIKTPDGYDFFGGVSKGIEKRTRVKSRIIANALSDMIKTSSNVLIMGHKYGDLDCVGASIGLADITLKLGKPANIIIDYDTTLSKALVSNYKNDKDNVFIPSNIALEHLNNETLVIIVDTHNPQFVESNEIYKKANQVVVIDHHRKMVNHIDNAVIFYHEPFSSSTCEMVAELIQYMADDYKPSKIVAESLMAGIMLDTKNFVMKTGVRTFEAAAYLIKMRADTVAVKKIFASSLNEYLNKTKLVSNSEIYKNCAIATSEKSELDLRIAAAQAADELLGINGVSSSFVIYETDLGVSVSARSLGEINVQIIMEYLGGGGHQTMAGAQIKNVDLFHAKQLLINAIDKYYYEQNKQ